MNGGWTIKAGGRAYGPYSAERMRAFAIEGRVGPRTLVAREGADDWHAATTDPELAGILDIKPVTPAASFTPIESRTPAPAPAPAAQSAQAAQAATGPAHFIIVLDMKSRAVGNLEETILSFGNVHRLLPNVWIVSTDWSIGAVRNAVVQELGKLDTAFVVDATRNKAAWFNFGPEVDAKIRRVWQKVA